jgi:hypothetical protein
MKLHERIGLSYEQVDPEDRAKAAHDPESILDRVDLIPAGQVELCINSSSAAVAYYLVDDYGCTRRYGQRVVPAALDYYFGKWRTKVKTDLGTIDSLWWHDQEPWMDVFRAALCWGSVLEDWPGLRKLAEYPDERRSMEKFGIDNKPAMRQLLLDIAKHLRGEKVANVADRVGKLVGAQWRGTRVLAGALDAIVARDETAANKAIHDFLMLRHKRKRSKDMTDSVSLDATIFTNLARRAGLRITVDPKLNMYVIKL